MPLIDDVPAEGLTPEELKEVITQRTLGIHHRPGCDRDGPADQQQDGVHHRWCRSSTHLSAQLRHACARSHRSSAGGFFVVGKEGVRCEFLRKTSEGLVEYRFNYKAYLKGKEPDSNILLKPGDTIVVPD